MHTHCVLRIHRLSGRIACRCLLLHVAHAWEKRIRVQFACLKFAVRLDELYADVYSCMLGMRNKKRIIMRGARTMTMTLMMAMKVMMEMTMAMV
jgi:hypothetical protein